MQSIRGNHCRIYCYAKLVICCMYVILNNKVEGWLEPLILPSL